VVRGEETYMYRMSFTEPTPEDYSESIAAEHREVERIAAEEQRDAQRRITRTIRPADYGAPTTAKELRARVAKGETYFSGTILVKQVINFPLDNLNFDSSIFQGCKFESTCSMKEVTFKQSRLTDCYLAFGVSVSGADFENAQIERCVGLFLDANHIRGTKFGAGVNHLWLILRAAYGAQWQIYHVMFGFAYFLPLLGKIVFLSALATAQSKIDPQVWREHHFVERSLPSLLFQESGVLWYLALLVLTYQVLRAFLAYRMAPLILWEAMTGFVPKIEDYKIYFWLHLLVRLLSFLSIIAFFVQLWLLLSGSIYFPSSLIRNYSPLCGVVTRV
jgi:hypothetical protein